VAEQVHIVSQVAADDAEDQNQTDTFIKPEILRSKTRLEAKTEFADTNDNGAEMKVAFKIPSTEEVKEISFTRRPLGIDFNKKVPITVKQVNPDSAGAARGIRPGWQMVSINNNDVSNCTFDEVFRQLKAGAEVLPVVKNGKKNKSNASSAS
jgi:predicted metalloprotease with PDZ domain